VLPPAPEQIIATDKVPVSIVGKCLRLEGFDMQLRALTTYLSVVKHGSMTAAAKECGLTPGAVSLQMKLVEEHFGEAWLDRSTRGIRVTERGREAAAAIAETILRLEALRRRQDRVTAGRVTLGAIATVQQSTLPRALRALRDLFPNLQVYVIPGIAADLVRKVKAGELDCAIAVAPSAGTQRALEWRTLFRQPFVAVAPPDSSGRRVEDLLQAFEWIRYDRNSIGGRVAARYVAGLAVEPRCRIEMDSSDSILAMVAAGLGVSVIPAPHEHQLASHPARVIPLGPRAPVRIIGVAMRRNRMHERPLRAVVETFAGIDWPFSERG
jgi:DNA-binding transcriptional LysR family regulator